MKDNSDDGQTADQLALFPGWFSADHNESRTLDIYDALPKFVFNPTRDIELADGKPRTFNITIRGESLRVIISPADIQREDKWVRVFPGPREELVERVIRQIAAQDDANAHHHPHEDGHRRVSAYFSFSKIRRILADYGHAFKIAEIREALTVLSRTNIILEGESLNELHGHSATLIEYTYRVRKADKDGIRSYGRATLHPLATRSILALAWFPMNNERIMRLSSPIARWLTTRMYHSFRQAEKHGYILQKGYHIALATIIEESGLIQQQQIYRASLPVLMALKEMQAHGILNRHTPFQQDDRHAKTAGRPHLINVIWTLFPSNEVVEEIIKGNQHMKGLRSSQSDPATKITLFKLPS
jgi:hypothetical protein